MTIGIAIAAKLGRDFTLDIAVDLPVTGTTALLGPSGAGKTTILRALAGLDRHKGTIRFGDVVWQDATTFVAAHRRHVGYAMQGIGLIPHLTVADNLAYAARRAAAGRFDRDDIVARTGIGHLLTRMPAHLSGGEAQRASLARALSGQPRLLLMDEPLANLDMDGRGDLLAALADLFAMLPVPVVYVTHDAEEATRVASHTVRVRAGRIDDTL